MRSITEYGVVETALEYLESAKETRGMGVDSRKAILKLESELADLRAVAEAARAFFNVGGRGHDANCICKYCEDFSIALAKVAK